MLILLGIQGNTTTYYIRYSPHHLEQEHLDLFQSLRNELTIDFISCTEESQGMPKQPTTIVDVLLLSVKKLEVNSPRSCFTQKKSFDTPH